MCFITRDVITSQLSRLMRNVIAMERSRIGLVLILVGIILFFISLLVVLLQFDFYLPSLFAMFISVVMIAIGFAYTRADEPSNGNSN